MSIAQQGLKNQDVKSARVTMDINQEQIIKVIIFISQIKSNVMPFKISASLVFILLAAAIASQGTNVTLANAPAINTTLAGSFNSVPGTTYYYSQRLEVLQITVTPGANAQDPNAASTLFRISFYNSAAAGSFNVYSLTLAGTWSYHSGTKETLSCTTIFNQGTGFYNLLKFNSAQGTFQQVPYTAITLMPSMLMIGFRPLQNCVAGYFFDITLVSLSPVAPPINNVPANNAPANNATVPANNANASIDLNGTNSTNGTIDLNGTNTTNGTMDLNGTGNGTNITNGSAPANISNNSDGIILTPPGWASNPNIQTISYGIANNILYRYDPATTLFTNIFPFPSPSQAYSLKSTPGKLVVVGSSPANITSNSTSILNVRQTFYVFTDAAATGIRLLGQFDINAAVVPPLSPQPINNNATNGTNTTNSSSIFNISALPNTPITANASNLIIPFYLAPSFTKLIVIFLPVNGATRQTLIKNIDFTKSTIVDVTFQDPVRFARTTELLRPDNTDFAVGENYFVIRNTSAFDPTAIPLRNAVEEAYQFVGTQAIFLRNRILSGTDLTVFKGIFIDNLYTTQLVIVNSYLNAGSFTVNSNIYGSLSTVNRVLPPPIPAYLSFYTPAATASASASGALGWAYTSVDATPATTFTFIRHTPAAGSNITYQTTTTAAKAGTWTIVSMTENCHIEKDATTNYNLVSRLPASATNSTLIVTPISITTAIAGLTISATSIWQISTNCERFAVAGVAFARNANSVFVAITNTSALPFTSIDREVTTAIVGNTIWQLSGSTFSNIYTYNGSILSSNQIYSSSSQIVITGANSTSAQVIALTYDTTALTYVICLDYIWTAFLSAPLIQVSSALTKVLVVGPYYNNATNITTQVKFDAFFIDYVNQQFQNISIPAVGLSDPLNNLVMLTEKFVYIRPRFANATNPIELIFYLDQDVTALQAAKNNLTSAQLSSWVKTVFYADPAGNFFFLVESTGGNATNPQVVVVKNQVSSQQATINSNTNNPGTTVTATVTSSGLLKLCTPGCADCSSGTCSSCVSGWSYDTVNSFCLRCGVNCLTCSSTNSQQCNSCIPGSYLSNTTCLPCDPTCITCTTTATSCSSCPPGQSWFGGACGSCARNCITCSNSSYCTACQNGFVAAGGKCRGCASSCSSCNPNNITQCTACANGLSLFKSKCILCPDKCQICNGAVCATCIPGYTPNAAGVCVISCQLPCATCVDNQPTICLSCYSGSTLSGTTCSFDFSCNDDSSCTDCGQGFGYVLAGSTCVACSSIDNCLQCSISDTESCSICRNGYFVDTDGTCTACSANCNMCLSSGLCTACAVGYTVPSGQTQGQCIACTSPCATCLGSSTYCLSCVANYTKKSWKCQKNIYVSFTFTIVEAPTNVFALIDSFVAALLSILRESSDRTDVITMDSIVSSSTIAVGSASPSSGDAAAASALISSAISSSTTIGNLTISASSITVTGTTSSDSSSGNKTGLIVGLVVGLTVFVVIVILIAVIIYKKRLAEQSQVGASEHMELKQITKENTEVDFNNSLNSIGDKNNKGAFNA